MPTEATASIREALVKRQIYEAHPGVLALLNAGTAIASQSNGICLVSTDAAKALDEEVVGEEVSKVQALERKIQDLESNRPSEEDTLAFLAVEEEICSTIAVRMHALEDKRRDIEETSDPMQKQELLVQCRKEQGVLNNMAKNLSDTGKKLDVVIDFLSDIQSHLTQIDEKLSSLQNQVSVMQEDLLRLAGKPVMEFIAEKRQQQLRMVTSTLQAKVFIERKHLPFALSLTLS